MATTYSNNEQRIFNNYQEVVDDLTLTPADSGKLLISERRRWWGHHFAVTLCRCEFPDCNRGNRTNNGVGRHCRRRRHNYGKFNRERGVGSGRYRRPNQLHCKYSPSG
jgi:hypothetical protein